VWVSVHSSTAATCCIKILNNLLKRYVRTDVHLYSPTMPSLCLGTKKCWDTNVGCGIYWAVICYHLYPTFCCCAIPSSCYSFIACLCACLNWSLPSITEQQKTVLIVVAAGFLSWCLSCCPWDMTQLLHLQYWLKNHWPRSTFPWMVTEPAFLDHIIHVDTLLVDGNTPKWNPGTPPALGFEYGLQCSGVSECIQSTVCSWHWQWEASSYFFVWFL